MADPPRAAPPAGCGVLLTRPEPGTSETAARVAALGWRPLLCPALTLTPRRATLPPAQALLLSSRAAARALAGARFAGPILAVGAATAAEADAAGLAAAGFALAAAAGGDAAALAELVGARLDPARGPLLLAVGAGYGGELAVALRQRGFSVLRRVVYDAAPAQALPGTAMAALRAGEVAVALFFSPRSAQATIGLLRRAGLQDSVRTVLALAISPRVADTVASLPWHRVAFAARPDQDALLGLLGPCPAGSGQGAARRREEA